MASLPTLSRRRAIGLFFVVSAVGIMLLGRMPLTTRQGVNFQVSNHAIPAYAKVVGFLHRHYEYQALAGEITRNCKSAPECAPAVFSWTRSHVQPTPKGWPVVDDHILNIIIRGHGLEDQMADVFTTLCTYAGMPAFWVPVKRPGVNATVVLSFVRIDGRWTVVDVARGLMFRRPDRQLASVKELQADESIIAAAAGTLQLNGSSYSGFLTPLVMPTIPKTLRAQLQMPGPRLFYEFSRLFTGEKTDGS